MRPLVIGYGQLEDALHQFNRHSSSIHVALLSQMITDVATVTVDVPTFGCTEKNKNKWTKPSATKFHLKPAGKQWGGGACPRAEEISLPVVVAHDYER